MFRAPYRRGIPAARTQVERSILPHDPLQPSGQWHSLRAISCTLHGPEPAQLQAAESPRNGQQHHAEYTHMLAHLATLLPRAQLVGCCYDQPQSRMVKVAQTLLTENWSSNIL